MNSRNLETANFTRRGRERFGSGILEALRKAWIAYTSRLLLVESVFSIEKTHVKTNRILLHNLAKGLAKLLNLEKN